MGRVWLGAATLAHTEVHVQKVSKRTAIRNVNAPERCVVVYRSCSRVEPCTDEKAT